MIDGSRIDLAREFRAKPWGRHSPDLQHLLCLMRRPGNKPFHVLVVEKPGERWRLGVMAPGGTTPPALQDAVFTDLAEAEWHVFKLRWAELMGRELLAIDGGEA
jgi:hypothetical protein